MKKALVAALIFIIILIAVLVVMTVNLFKNGSTPNIPNISTTDHNGVMTPSDTISDSNIDSTSGDDVIIETLPVPDSPGNPECSHSFTAWVVTKRATCLEGGTESRYCLTCGKTETISTAVTDHNIVIDRGQQESCVKTGLTAGSHCADCNKIIEKQEIVPVTAHVHSPLDGKEATCNETGLTEGVECAMCGCVIVAQNVIPKLEHSYGEWTVTKEVTCTVDGISSRFCKYCNREETKTIASTGAHNYDFKIMSCTTCGAAVEPSDGLVFKLNDDGTSYACCGKEKYKLNGYDVIIIPGEYNGKPVTRVTSGSAGSGWFNCKTLVLCEGIEILNISTPITKIKEIYLPESINGLSSNTFCMAESLEYVYAPYSTWSVYGVYTQKYDDDIILSDPHEAAVTLTKLSSYKKLYRK